jgi:glycosyltransferase involved in cell wall biosynthesis
MLTATSIEEIQKALTNLLENYSPLSDMSSSFDYAQKFDWNNIASDMNKIYEVIRNRN